MLPSRSVTQAWKQYKRGNLKSALQIAHRLQEEAPYDAELLFLIGNIALRRKQWFDAAEALAQAQQLNFDGNQDILFYSGYALLMYGGLEVSCDYHTDWINNYVSSINRIGELINESIRDSKNVIVIEQEDDRQVLQNKDHIKEQCLTLQRLYGSLSPSDTLQGKIDEIIRDLKQLTDAIEACASALKPQGSE